MRIFSLLISILCLIFGGCSKSDPVEKRSEKSILVDQILKSCAKTLSKRHHLYQCGDGAAMMFEIEDLFLAFDIYRSLTREEARAMLIDCAHEVINTVNHHPAVQKYLLSGGFTKKSVQIQIYIYPDHKHNYYPDLGVCAYNFGRLAYHSYDPDNDNRYKTSERETYEQALALLNLSPDSFKLGQSTLTKQ